MKKKLNIASVFSGIGAFEQALKQLGIPHNILFACDNGERELKFSRKQIQELSKDLDESNRRDLVNQLMIANKLEETGTEALYNTIYVDRSSKYSSYLLNKEAIVLLSQAQGFNNAEKYVEYLYGLLNKPNLVKKSFLANYHLDEKNWHEDVRFLEGLPYRNKVDILVGGSPCQSFSTYGKKRGLEDTRGTLFYDYARLIQQIQPKVFIYENVKGLLSHDKGKTWEIMKEVWESLDYNIFYQVLNAKDYNLPQMRKRLFVVGISKNLDIDDFEFPPKMELQYKSSDFLEDDVPNSYYLPEKGFKWTTDVSRNKNKSRINRDVIGCQTAVQQFNWSGDFRLEPAKERHYNDPNIYVGKKDDKDVVVRKLMPIECLRLMGFKDFKIVVDDNDMYRQSGNSIAVPVITAVLKKVLECVFDK